MAGVRKSAEGTIGSLMGVAIEEYDTCYNDNTAQRETLYVVHWQKDCDDCDAGRA